MQMTNRRMKMKKLERIAYHEAGHAVAQYLSNVQFKYVEICDSEKKPSYTLPTEILKKMVPLMPKDLKAGGRVVALKRKQRFSDRDGIFIILAGAAAESLRYRNRLVAMLSNMHEVLEIELMRNGESDDYLFDEARGKLKQPAVWYAVETLVQELLTHHKILYLKAVEIIDKAIKDYIAKGGDAL